MRLLPPQRLRPHYYEGVEQALREAFDVFLFAPLRALVVEAAPGAAALFENAGPVPSRELVDALRRGTIQYVGGRFSGAFDAKLTRAVRALGAEFDARLERYVLPEWAAPGWLKAEAAGAQARAAALHDKLLRELDRLQQRLEFMPTMVPAGQVIEAIEDGFEAAAASLSIVKRIPAAQRAAMEARYQEDVRPYVVKDTAQFIDDVHAAVTKNAALGYRYETIVEDIEHYAQVSERKARFLARQETSLFMAGYRRERFTAAGVTRYTWSTSHDIRVRPYGDDEARRKYGDHRALDGQVFTYEHKAPASFMSSKKPCNPGEDFQCRCADRAMIE